MRNEVSTLRLTALAKGSYHTLTISQIQSLDGEIDNRRVPLLDKVVLRKPPEMQNHIRRQLCDLVSANHAPRFLEGDAVVLCQDLGNGDLRNDVLLDHVLEDRRGREVNSEEEEGRSVDLDVCTGDKERGVVVRKRLATLKVTPTHLDRC